MANAGSGNFKVYLNAESAWGTPVASGAYAVRLTGGVGKTATESALSKEITNYENTGVTRTRVSAGGSYNFELSYATAEKELDLLLSSLFGAAWNTKVLKVGNTRKSFSLEEWYTDISHYIMYAGCLCNSIRIEVRPGDMITGSFGFVSLAGVAAGTAIFTAPTAANTNAVMNPLDSIQTLEWGGVAIPGVTAFSMELKRGNIVFPQLSDIDPADIQMGTFEATGSISMYVADDAYITDYLTWAQHTLEITLGGASSNNYLFNFGRVNLTDGGIESLTKDAPVIQTYNWAAEFTPTDTTCKVTRST